MSDSSTAIFTMTGMRCGSYALRIDDAVEDTARVRRTANLVRASRRKLTSTAPPTAAP